MVMLAVIWAARRRGKCAVLAAQPIRTLAEEEQLPIDPGLLLETVA